MNLLATILTLAVAALVNTQPEVAAVPLPQGKIINPVGSSGTDDRGGHQSGAGFGEDYFNGGSDHFNRDFGRDHLNVGFGDDHFHTGFGSDGVFHNWDSHAFGGDGQDHGGPPSFGSGGQNFGNSGNSGHTFDGHGHGGIVRYREH